MPPANQPATAEGSTRFNLRPRPLSDEEHARLLASPPSVRSTSEVIASAAPATIVAVLLVAALLIFGFSWPWYAWLPACMAAFFLVPMLAGWREGVADRRRILEWLARVEESERWRGHR